MFEILNILKMVEIQIFLEYFENFKLGNLIYFEIFKKFKYFKIFKKFKHFEIFENKTLVI